MPFRLIFDDEQLEDNVNILKSVHGTTSRVYLLPDPKELWQTKKNVLSRKDHNTNN